MTEDLVKVLALIEYQAAAIATQMDPSIDEYVQTLAELIEGLAQALRQVVEEQRQGWAPVLNETPQPSGWDNLENKR